MYEIMDRGWDDVIEREMRRLVLLAMACVSPMMRHPHLA